MKKITKVLMFGWEFPPYCSGGVGTACYGLTRHMALEGAKITLVVPKIQGEMHHFFLNIVDGEKVLNLKCEKKDLDEGKTYSKDHLQSVVEEQSLLSPYLNEKEYQKRLSNLSSKSKCEYGNSLINEVERFSKVGKFVAVDCDYDVIHAHDWMTCLAALEAKKRTNLPLVIHVHTTEYDRNPGKEDQAIVDIERTSFNQADRVVAVSQQTKEGLVNHYGVNESKVDVIYNAVEKGDTVKFDRETHFLRKKKVILFLGRITSQKGPMEFINAAEEVIKKVSDVRFVMAGDGDMAVQIIDETKKRKINDYFYFTGHLRTAEREKLYSLSDLYVMPSISEPFGITPLEVMKYNIPIILSENVGAKEVIDGAITYSDSKMLPGLIVKVLEDKKFRNSVIKNYGKSLDKISWQESAKKVLKLYRNLFSKKIKKTK